MPGLVFPGKSGGQVLSTPARSRPRAAACGREHASTRRWHGTARVVAGRLAPELDLPGYDALGTDGANINLAIGVEAADPLSGAASYRCYPCQIERLA